MRLAVGNADTDFLDSVFFGNFGGTAVQTYRRTTARFVGDFDVLPRNTGHPAGAKSFKNGFLCRPPARKMLIAAPPLRTVTDLGVREHAVHEVVAVLFDHSTDPLTLDNVRSDADDCHCSCLIASEDDVAK